MGWTLTPCYTNDSNLHNLYGFRGNDFNITKNSDSTRIVCIGGSTTYGTSVIDYKNSYPYQLGLFLNNYSDHEFEVINAGVGNADSWYSLINYFFNIQYLKPDILIIYHGDNDLESRFSYPKNKYKSDNTGNISSSVNILSRQSIFNHSFTLRLLGYHSSLLRTITGKIYPYDSLNTLYSSDTNYYYKYLDSLKNNTNHNEQFWQDLLDSNSLFYTKNNLTNIIMAAKKHSTSVILSSFMYIDVTNETSSPCYKRGISEYNVMVNDLSFDLNISYFDLASNFPSDNSFFDIDGIHMNEKGNKLKAKLIAEHILETY